MRQYFENRKTVPVKAHGPDWGKRLAMQDRASRPVATSLIEQRPTRSTRSSCRSCRISSTRSSSSSSSSAWCVRCDARAAACELAAIRANSLWCSPRRLAHASQPCIGKTSFYEHWFKPRGYVAVGHQINGNLGKMLAAIRDSIAQGKAIVVDETNGLGAHARLAAVR